jgi:uncharacterized Zn-finger protein
MENIIECSLCKEHFSKKGSLTRHLRDKRCKSPLLEDLVLLNEFIKNLIIKSSSNHEPVHEPKSEPKVLATLNSLNLSYLTPDRLKPFLEKYDFELLEEYISFIIYNKEHPENYVVKYNTRYPPTFACEGSILVLEAATEKLAKPITDIIERHKKKCLKFYKDNDNADDEDDEFISEYKQRETLYKDLQSDVSKCIKKILKKILYDPEMKY